MLVQPVTRVRSSFAELLRDSFVVFAGGTEKRVAFAWLGSRNTMTVQEGLELRFGPAKKALIR